MKVRALLLATYTKWVDDRAPLTAAALAYYTVFSLAPLLLIAIGIAGLLLGEEQARAGILAQASALLGSRGGEAVEKLMGTEHTASQAGLVSTIVGAVTLLIGAVGVVAQLKDALNTVWDVTAPEHMSWGDYARRYLVNIALVIGTGFLLLVSLIVTATIGAATAAVRHWIPGPAPIWFAIDAIVGLALTTGVFALIFKVLPDAKVNWRDVLTGALFTSVLFTAGRMILGAYIGGSGRQSAYDAAGSILAILAWVYYSSQLVLFGAEFTRVHSASFRHLPSPIGQAGPRSRHDRRPASVASILDSPPRR
jgi:membrane protein